MKVYAYTWCEIANENGGHTILKYSRNNSLDLEVLVSILRACHPLFPITHPTTPKNYLLDSQVSASKNTNQTVTSQVFHMFKN